ncbi:hypothetical protein LDK53_02765 [Enterobacter sp. K16B]|uniref:hypothetical protein n=1 Tax=Enterobacter sp. K16B TaxID=2878537 RepID=UPI001CDA2329|nr:hypothetical protein [Enterobacter sp. K16B]MCA2024851.1 hypothetical protein [Enterobacter sp. K16B]
MNQTGLTISTIISFFMMLPLSYADNIITDTNKETICPVAEKLTDIAYEHAYMFSDAGSQITNPIKLNLAILASQGFWDLYPSVLLCANANIYEQQFAKLGINKDNAKLEINSMQNFANSIHYTPDVDHSFPPGGASASASFHPVPSEGELFASGKNLPTHGGVSVSGETLQPNEKITISVPTDLYLEKNQQLPIPTELYKERNQQLISP